MALEDSRAKGIVSSRQLLKLFPLIKPLVSMQRYTYDGRVPFCRTIDCLQASASDGSSIEICPRQPDDHCLITFTSGSTGRPKGADRTHEGLIEQHLALKENGTYIAGDVGLSCFPVAALHQFACGVPTVLPRADLARIGDFNPQHIVDQINTHRVSILGTAPAFLEKLVTHLEKHQSGLPSLRGIVVGGSTVNTGLLARTSRMLPSIDIWVIYGSTESEPISHIQASEILEKDCPDGFLVGHPVSACELRIVDSLGKSFATEADVMGNSLPPGHCGEIFVSGKHVLKKYIDNEAATRETKIPRNDGAVWHRTGDFGYLDSLGRICLVGRDKDLIRYEGQIVANYSVEKKIDALSGVRRSAIVDVEGNIGVFLQLENQSLAALESEIFSACAPIERDDVTVFLVDSMPVDGRHNSKVDRPTLRALVRDGKLSPAIASPRFAVPRSNRNGLIEEWKSPTRIAALTASLACVFLVWMMADLSFPGFLHALALNYYIQLPVVFGGVLHMYVVRKDFLPALKIPINQALFGANKTWRGVLVVTGLTVLGAWLLSPLEWLQRALFGDSLLAGYSLMLVGLAGGVGYVLGEIPNSYLKRRLGAAPGEMPRSHPALFVALDQIDSAVGIALMFWLVGMPATVNWLFLVTFPITALVVKHYLHRYNLKNVAR